MLSLPSISHIYLNHFLIMQPRYFLNFRKQHTLSNNLLWNNFLHELLHRKISTSWPPCRFFNLFLYCCSSIVASICPPPLPTTPAIPTSHPRSYPPLALSMGPLYMFLTTLPLLPPIIPSHLPSSYCQFVLNFNVSGYILLAYLFCWLGSTYRWDQQKERRSSCPLWQHGWIWRALC